MPPPPFEKSKRRCAVPKQVCPSPRTHTLFIQQQEKKRNGNERRREPAVVTRRHDKGEESSLRLWFAEKRVHTGSPYLMTLKRFDERKLMYLLTVGISCLQRK